MFKFFKKHPPKEGEEREKLKKELFGFKKCTDHGFISKPSAMAYDPKLRLLAVGSKSGVLKVLGSPGVEFTAQHDQDVTVVQLFFLPEQSRLVSFCSDNSLHLWETNVRGGKTVLEEIKSYNVETSKTKSVSTCCLSVNGEQLFLGTEGGNIQILDVKDFSLSEQVIYQDVVMQNVPDDFKVNPGAVEAIAVHPTNPDKFLIGYNRGLIVLWDNKESNANQTYNVSRQLESLTWHRNGTEFTSAHSDGSYSIWSVSDASKAKEEQTPYGPFPCKAITKLERKTAKADPFLIFSGGMPRASYGDKHTVTVMQGENHTVFDFTSRIIDFIILSRADESDTPDDRSDNDEPHSLVVLAEEEIVAIDLDSVNWPTFRLPYLNSIHSSAITCSQHIANVPDQLWQKINDVGEAQLKNFSPRTWPINGGRSLSKDPTSKAILLTGHEDGTVRFWDASSSNLRLLYKLTTVSYFDISAGDQNSAEEEEEWPPFRKVGTFDPYSDDPRLSIQKITLCPLSETLVIAGTAGQVITFQMEREEREQEVKSTTVNIVSDRDSFVWKGHEALVPKEGDVKFAAGFQPIAMMQLYPPAAVTALALHSEWQIIGAGTAHGFGLYDYVQKKEISSRCTLNPTDLTGTSETAMSRRKSLKKSLRESFRRLRKGRSERRARDAKAKTETQHIEQAAETAEGATAAPGTPEHKPVERQIEARSNEDSMCSMVRCIYFADTFIVNGAPHNPSLWVGTNGGHVYIYNLTVPASDKRSSDAVGCQLAKEIKLKHRAPVISMAVIDSRARILPEPLEVQNERAKAADMVGPHSVIICSEEQLKTFTLPALKPKWKSKITAQDGSRIRRIGFVNFRSKSADNYSEFDIACLSNLGEILVYAVTTLRQQMHVTAIRKEDINGIASFIFTKDGQAFYLKSSSEFDRITLSPRHVTCALGMLDLKEGMRPDPDPEADNPADDTADITIGLADDSQHNDSRGDTTGDITVDSIRDLAAEGEDTITNMVTNASNAAANESSNVIQSVTTYSSTVMSTMESSVTSSVREVTTSFSRHQSSDVQETTSGGDSGGGGNDGGSGDTGGGEPNLKNIDDDTKATVTKTIETTEVTEKITDLKLSEEKKIMNNGDPVKTVLTEN
ncbi:lethal(2) giant larvae protein homolog 1 isoform X2 [Patella vulgata]|uniref:lethal(2) giant larvae protein homolog 1 isoform X2 n=1 Tax=Patella vulgata TaxID=6465 RepID=UPI00218081C4|nr:lethal(2) giant larvae protein homolog 1 isoform X2 [Patella vulgata]